jgi:large subunit ribosomal protein L23
MGLNLSLYDILQGPVLTDKARDQYQDESTLVIRVHPQSNKPQIKQALERLFNVKVEKVRTVLRKGKLKFNRKKRTTTTSIMRKHAYITLAAGYSLDLVSQGNVQTAEQTPAQQAD